MFQFGSYPIYVVYSLNRQKKVDPMWKEHARDHTHAQKSAFEGLKKLDFGRFQRQIARAGQSERLIYATWDWQLVEDLGSKYKNEIQAFDRTIRQMLTNISATRVGAILLKSILTNPTNAKIWIIPASWENAPAKTQLYSPLEGGGIRVHFYPSAFGRDAEPTLIHELVHAKRYAWNQYNAQSFESDDMIAEFSNGEEFLATQVENIHIASRKLTNKYSSYDGPRRDKSSMYKFFTESKDAAVALKYFIDKDPMIAEMSRLKNPEYNPFRDLEQIKKAAYIGPEEMRSDWK